MRPCCRRREGPRDQGIEEAHSAALTPPVNPPNLWLVRSFLSLILALLILLVFGGVAFFLWNTSAKAEFKRIDKQEEPGE